MSFLNFFIKKFKKFIKLFLINKEFPAVFEYFSYSIPLYFYKILMIAIYCRISKHKAEGKDVSIQTQLEQELHLLNL